MCSSDLQGRDLPGLEVGERLLARRLGLVSVHRGSLDAVPVEALGETVRQRVKAISGVDLEWEIKRIGVN